VQELASLSSQRLSLWRAVEAQHVVSTNALVDTLEEQAALERILEASKPKLPAGPPLHYLIATPFRYPPLPLGSRFRGPADPGLFYGAEEIRTACAEVGYWRWRFLIASQELTALPARPQTVFLVAVAGLTVDLRRPPYLAQRSHWTDPSDYRACQAFAREARAAGVSLIRYESVRDPKHAGCGVVLTTGAFLKREPLAMQTWLLEVKRTRVSWLAASVVGEERFEFEFKA
jgi:hypothetical protein